MKFPKSVKKIIFFYHISNYFLCFWIIYVFIVETIYIRIKRQVKVSTNYIGVIPNFYDTLK